MTIIQRGEPMSDLISRQAAIANMRKNHDVNLGTLPTGNRSYEDIWHCVAIAYDEGIEYAIKVLNGMPSAQPELPIKQKCTICPHCDNCDVNDDGTISQPEPQWIPCERELPSDNREVEVTCDVRCLNGKICQYTCHASYVHRYSIESTDYCNWEECDEYNEEEDKYYALPGWYERVHNWDDYSYCAIEDFVTAWRELPDPWRGEEQ